MKYLTDKLLKSQQSQDPLKLKAKGEALARKAEESRSSFKYRPENINKNKRAKAPTSFKEAINALLDNETMKYRVYGDFELGRDNSGKEYVDIFVPNRKGLSIAYLRNATHIPAYADILHKLGGDYAPIKTNNTNINIDVMSKSGSEKLNEAIDRLQELYPDAPVLDIIIKLLEIMKADG